MPPARVENSPPPQAEAAYWDSVVRGASSALNCTLWRLFCDRLHERLIQKWVGRQRFGLALKTDLFDEAQGQGLVEVLGALSREVYGMDIAADIVQNAARKNPGLKASVGDVRKLDFPDDAFDFICSDSTLDHFATLGELRQSIAELVRVLQPGGRLLITLDNPVNPLVALRNQLPQGRMGALGLVPYFMGRTLSMGELAGELRSAGLEVLAKRHLMHVPRVAALHLCRLLSGWPRVHRVVVRIMLAFEALAVLPTARFTGHFSAVLARKSESTNR